MIKSNIINSVVLVCCPLKHGSNFIFFNSLFSSSMLVIIFILIVNKLHKGHGHHKDMKKLPAVYIYIYIIQGIKTILIAVCIGASLDL